jgi:hypothetical protein
VISELVLCFRCKSDYLINYGGHRLDDELVTSITPCKCKRIEVKKSNIKPLDAALLKLKDVLNETVNRRPN